MTGLMWAAVVVVLVAIASTLLVWIEIKRPDSTPVSVPPRPDTDTMLYDQANRIHADLVTRHRELVAAVVELKGLVASVPRAQADTGFVKSFWKKTDNTEKSNGVPYPPPPPGRPVKPPRPQVEVVLMDADERVTHGTIVMDATRRQRVIEQDGTRYVAVSNDGDRFVYRAES